MVYFMCSHIHLVSIFVCFHWVNGVGVMPKLALATSEALPYGRAAFIFCEMWNATAGLGFMMTVAAATYQIDKGMAGFGVLVSLFGMTHIILHCIAKKMWTKTAETNPVL